MTTTIRVERSYDELFEHAAAMIGRSHRLTETMMADGFIAEAPEHGNGEGG